MGIKVLPASREILASLVGKTLSVVGVYARVGARQGPRRGHATVLVTNVRDANTGTVLTDHLWFNQGRVWRRAHLVPGDVIAFSARVIEYRTGYWGPNSVRKYLSPARVDFCLTPPSGLRVIWRSTDRREEAA